MTFPKISPPMAMGGLMGLMLPWMMHGDRAAGIAFVLVHVGIVAMAAGLFLLLPSLRQRLARVAHLPRPAHGLPMLGGLVAGWAATCVYCLAIGGLHWT